MPRFRGRENLYELGNHSARQRSARDDRGQLPPLGRVSAKLRDYNGRDGVGDNDGDDRSDPNQRSQRRLEIHYIGFCEARFGDQVVDKIRQRACHQHGDTHHEDPNQQLNLHRRALYSQQDECNQRHTGDAVGFESVRGWSDGIARVVSGAVGNHAGVARVVFLNFENDFHQVGANIGNLGEDTARDSQRSCSERLADSEADKALPGIVTGDEE